MPNKKPNPRLEKAQAFHDSIKTKSYATNSISRYEASCNVLIDTYRDAIKSSITPKHKHLSSRNDYMLFKNYGVLKLHLINSYALESELSLLKGVELQVDALKGKPSKKFINGLLKSCESFLDKKAKASNE